MKSKTQIAIDYYNSGDLKKSLKIFKNFDRMFSKNDLNILQISYECLAGNKDFYKQLSYDIDEFIEQSNIIISNKITEIKK